MISPAAIRATRILRMWTALRVGLGIPTPEAGKDASLDAAEDLAAEAAGGRIFSHIDYALCHIAIARASGESDVRLG